MDGPVFTRKKVGSLTLGEKLRKLRSDYRMSLSDVSKATKIQIKYLEALESGDYAHLPADVYVRGFVRGYSRHLGVNEEAILRLYERERNIEKNLGRDAAVPLTPTQSISVPRFVVTSRTVIVGGIILLMLLAATYLIVEFQSFVSAPRLIVVEPRDGAIVEEEGIVVRGKTDRGVRILINGQPVFLNAEGEFAEKIPLQPGVNTLLISVTNRFGKTEERRLLIESRPPTPPDENPTDEVPPTEVDSPNETGAL